MFSPAELEKKLSELIDVHGVPGAQLSVLDGDQLTEVAAGVLSQRTGCPSRPDALFLPGSIGKLYTATLVMMLVEEGKLDLDVPIRHYLPDFEVRDPHARDTVTARQLLSHTSGFDGDHFTDTGRGDDALARYVAGCSDLPQIVAPGKIWSYSNSGYAVLGRVVEVLSGLTFEEALRERLFTPLALDLDGLVRGRGDRAPRRGRPRPRSRGPRRDWSSPRRGDCTARSPPWAAPSWPARATSCGSSACTSSGGLAPDGSRLLDAALVDAMQVPQIGLVDDTISARPGASAGSSTTGATSPSSATTATPWGRTPSCASRRPSSSGSASRRTSRAPCRSTGSSPTGCSVSGSVSRPAATPTCARTAVTDPGRYVGTYARVGLDIDVHVDDAQRLVATVTPSHGIAEEQGWPPMVDLPLQPVDREDSFLLRLPIADADLLAVFFNPDEEGGRPTYLHYGGRAHRRT